MAKKKNKGKTMKKKADAPPAETDDAPEEMSAEDAQSDLNAREARLRRSFGDGFLGKDSPLINTILQVLRNKYPQVFEAGAATQVATGEVVKEWLEGDACKALVARTLDERMASAVDERLEERMGQLREELLGKIDENMNEAGGLTAEFVEVKLTEARAQTIEQVREIVHGEVEANPQGVSEEAVAEAVQHSLADAGFTTLEEVDARIAEGHGLSDEQILDKIEETVTDHVGHIGFVTEDQLNERLADAPAGGGPAPDMEGILAEVQKTVDARLADLPPASPGETDGSLQETVEEMVTSVLAEEAKELVVRIKQNVQVAVDDKFQAFSSSEEFSHSTAEKVRNALVEASLTEEDINLKIEETIKAAIAGAMQSSFFTDAVQAAVGDPPAAEGGGVDENAVRGISKKVTEEILMREAAGLVKQVKVEVNKVQKKIDALGSGGISPEDLDKVREEIQTSFGSKIEQFLGSDDFRDLVGSVSEERTLQVLASDEVKGVLGGGGGGGEGGMVSPAQLQSLVETAVSTRMAEGGGGGGEGGGDVRAAVEQVLNETMANHVGKYLDEKLPPPEYFENLATVGQVREEIEKRMAGSGSMARGGGGGGSGLMGSPGESAVFTNLITRILGSDDLKEMIDDKFKVINNYIKNELVPRVVKKILKEKGM